MPTFPHLKATAVYVYTPFDPGALAGRNLNIHRLQDLLHDRWMDRFVPEDLATLDKDTTQSERWGWCYPDNRDTALHVHHYVSFGTRRWVKKAPPSLVKAHVQQQEEDLRQQDLPKPMRKARIKEYKEEITRRLVRETPPTVEEDMVVWDDEHKRLVLFTASGAKRDTLAGHVDRILQGMFKTEIGLQVESMHGHLARSRATAMLPGNVHERFWTWLLSHAAADRTEVFVVPVGDVSRSYTIVVGEHYKSHAGDVVLKSADRVAEWINETLNEGAVGVNPAEVELLISDEPQEGGFRWKVRLNGAAQLVKVSLEDSRDTDKQGDYDGMALVRADALLEAHDLIHLLVSAFDAGVLTKLLEESPQTGLFPLEARTGGTWMVYDDWNRQYAPRPPVPEETPIERAARLGVAVVHSSPDE